MTHVLKLAIIATLFLLTGCYSGISGKVVDGVTGNPIQGAVVLAQWSTSGGLPGLRHRSHYKIEETETDKEGMFSLSGVYHPLVDEPAFVIYKKGYVPWRNDMNFKDYIPYDKNIWQSNMTYKLDLLKEGYSIARLEGFISDGIHGLDLNKTPKFLSIQTELYKMLQAEADEKKKLK